jgi:hypothetical protein
VTRTGTSSRISRPGTPVRSSLKTVCSPALRHDADASARLASSIGPRRRLLKLPVQTSSLGDVSQYYSPCQKKLLIVKANVLISRSAQSRTCPWVSAGPLIGEDTVRYLELTPPVAISAFREMRGHLKQRRCGPFCSLPAFHQPGLLKRHTIIAGSAVGFIPVQSMADKAGSKLLAGRWSTSCAFERDRSSGISTGRAAIRRRTRLCPPVLRRSL